MLILVDHTPKNWLLSRTNGLLSIAPFIVSSEDIVRYFLNFFWRFVVSPWVSEWFSAILMIIPGQYDLINRIFNRSFYPCQFSPMVQAPTCHPIRFYNLGSTEKVNLHEHTLNICKSMMFFKYISCIKLKISMIRRTFSAKEFLVYAHCTEPSAPKRTPKFAVFQL